jgi:hypothetical protein
LVAGAWVLYTFAALGSTNKARAEIAELEQRAVEQPVLGVHIKPAVFTNDSGRLMVALEVSLQNDGKRALQFRNSGARISRLVAGKTGMSVQGASAHVPAVIISDSGTTDSMPPRILRAGQARTLVWLMPVATAGTYLIQFDVVYSGMQLVNGSFVPSVDEPIVATEQSILNVPPAETWSLAP